MKIPQILANLKRLMDNKGINELKQSFHNLKEDATWYYGARFLYVCEWDSVKEMWHIEFDTDHGYEVIEETFGSYLKAAIQEYLDQIENELVNQHLCSNGGDLQSLISKVELQLNYLADETSKNKEIFNAAFEVTDDFIKKITSKYNAERRFSADIQSEFEPKIKWLGYWNTLATFLWEYSSADNNLKKPLIERDICAFKALMLKCFVDKDGHSVSAETVNTYFDTNKQREKTAKKEVIEISTDLPVSRPAKNRRVMVKYAKEAPVPKGMDKPSTRST